MTNKYQGDFIDIGQTEFNRVFSQDSQYNIIRRECATCDPSHQNIYYRRFTDPNLFDAYSTMIDWTVTNNVMNTDFQLYSTLQDAIDNTSAWIYCNYDDPSHSIAAFRDCGPSGPTCCQITADAASTAWIAHSTIIHDTKFSILLNT